VRRRKGQKEEDRKRGRERECVMALLGVFIEISG
jgi:hypothetical protein